MKSSLTFFLALTLASSRCASAQVIFDTFTPPDIGGGSSPGGVYTQIAASIDVPITNIAVLNRMQEPGRLRFAIFSHPAHERLYLSSEVFFPKEGIQDLTWKISPQFDFILEGSKSYDIGYVHDGSVYDVLDRTSESYNGLTTELWLSVAGGDFQNPTLDTHFFEGRDGGIRLYNIPEPSTLTLVVAVFSGLAIRRRKSVPHNRV